MPCYNTAGFGGSNIMKSKNYEQFIGVTKSRLTPFDIFRKKEKIGHRKHFKCWCSCGKIGIIACSKFESGSIFSCGCLRLERTSTQNLIDNRKKMPEYVIWGSIVQRCCNPNNIHYRHYGGRGITICDSWRSDFANFLNDMGRRPEKGYSVERIDNNGNYEMSNCKWATKKEQNNNTRKNIFIEMDGEKLTAAMWGEKLGINSNIITSRIRKGWDGIRAIKTPIIPRIKHEKHNN